MNNAAGHDELLELRRLHRDLDDRISEISLNPVHDQIEVARLKKRKLQLRDEIERLLDTMIPDIIA